MVVPSESRHGRFTRCGWGRQRLGSLEDRFGLSTLGFAADVPATFGSDVYTNF